jgi:hypothetical protein
VRFDDDADHLYVVAPAGGASFWVDVVDDDARMVAQWQCGDRHALAIGLLSDATGHPPKEAIAEAFLIEVLLVMPATGFALSASEICAWLLLRAIDRAVGEV